MVVGDIVNQIITVGSSFQPAAGVEIIVLKSFSGSDSVSYWGITDGVGNASQYANSSTSVTSWNTTGNKYGITNTNYYYNTATALNRGFSGIQIK